MKLKTTQSLTLILIALTLTSCSGSVMGPKDKNGKKDRPVIVSSPPSKESTSSSVSSASSVSSTSTRVSTSTPNNGSFAPLEQPLQKPNSDLVVSSGRGGLALEWINSQRSHEWIEYIFSDLSPKLRSQVSRRPLGVELKTRSVGVDDGKSLNYMVALLSFSSGESYVRDFKVEEFVLVKNTHSSDRFRTTLRDTISGKKVFVIEMERRHVSRLDPDRAELVARSPWAGTLSSLTKGKLNPVARLSGYLELLSLEQMENILGH